VKKKLIEVSLPLEAINAASAREKSIRHGHPSTLHLWWARRPLAAARAVIFAQMVDDPSANPDLFPTEKAQEKERKRLFNIIEELVTWENTSNERVLQAARDEIWQSWRRACAENVDHPRAKELFNRHKLPAFHDPFAGGGTLPLEAQRLGLEAYGSDLNPVAVLINKAMIEIPPKFAGKPPVNPESHRQAKMMGRVWQGAQGLAEDVRYYGEWMRDEAEKRIGYLYPKVEITTEMAKNRPDLKEYVGKKLTVIAWLWARTVKSPNPAFADVDVPLVATFMLSTKTGKEVYVEPISSNGSYRFDVKVGTPTDIEAVKNGTKLGRGNFRCVLSGTPISAAYIRTAGQAGNIGAQLMAIVADGGSDRLYLPPTVEMEDVARRAVPKWSPDTELFQQALGFRVGNYGIKRWSQLFTNRQLVALTTFTDLVKESWEKINHDCQSILASEELNISKDRDDVCRSYADALAVYLGLTSSKAARFTTTLSTWRPDETKLSRAFTRNDLAMTWDFAETNPFSGTGGDFLGLAEGTASVIQDLKGQHPGHASVADAQSLTNLVGRVVSTDPPYFDNVGYADLSDYFYVWLRPALKDFIPELFTTIEVPKADELVATPARHGGEEGAKAFFLTGMQRAMTRLSEQSHPAFPVTIYYAFKQSESENNGEIVSTGWETFLDSVIQAGFAVTGTWPVRTEGKTRMRSMGSNALASSIVLVCRSRTPDLTTTTRREFVTALKFELPSALSHLQRSNIAPVDLAQAAIGPGMAVYTRYSKVLDASGQPVSVREALALINQTLDEVLAEQEGDFDADTRWAVAWFEQTGFAEGEYGVADTLSKAKNTSVRGMEDAGIVASGRGRVRLLKPSELPGDWEPVEDARLTVWEMVHRLIRALEKGGESGAATLVAKLGSKSEIARELAYRLYTVSERKKRAQEALAYNALVQSWPEITRLARETVRPAEQQTEIFDQA
jgi:putative DNA methylase